MSVLRLNPLFSSYLIDVRDINHNLLIIIQTLGRKRAGPYSLYANAFSKVGQTTRARRVIIRIWEEDARFLVFRVKAHAL